MVVGKRAVGSEPLLQSVYRPLKRDVLTGLAKTKP